MKTKKDYSYGIIPFRKENDEWKVFLIHQFGHMGDFYWTFPKGHREEGETNHEAAQREFYEETGLTLKDLHKDIAFSHTYTFRAKEIEVEKTATYYLGLVNDGEFHTEDKEVKEAGWFGIEEAKNRLTFGETKELLTKAVKRLSQLEGSSQAVLYYDADCAFCTACANFVRRRDKRSSINLKPIQNSEYQLSDSCYESIIFISGSHQSQFSRAVIDTLKTMGGVWWFLGVLGWLVPRPIRDWLYRFVGERRHYFGGSKNTC